MSLKEKDLARIYFQIIGSLKIGAEGRDLEYTIGILRGFDVNMVRLTEVNKNYCHPVVKSAGEKTARDNIKGSQVAVASTEEYEMDGIRKSGGNMLVRASRVLV